jgi:hypothetical protein
VILALAVCACGLNYFSFVANVGEEGSMRSCAR